MMIISYATVFLLMRIDRANRPVDHCVHKMLFARRTPLQAVVLCALSHLV